MRQEGNLKTVTQDDSGVENRLSWSQPVLLTLILDAATAGGFTNYTEIGAWTDAMRWTKS